MHAEFWQSRWQRNDIGFHASEVNTMLARYWSDVCAENSSRVLVPLCGKSLDLLWLANRGHHVLGVELTETAVQAFFRELAVEPEVSEEGAFSVYRHGQLTLYCGDFFALTAEQLGHCNYYYDRAALIALPQDMRRRYVSQLRSLLAPHSHGLLITMDYQQELMSGPPFAVGDPEVQGFRETGWQVQLLDERNILDERFRQRGLNWLLERGYRMGLD